MAALVAIGAVVTIAIDDRIGVNDGMGWDGLGYSIWARDFPRFVLRDGVNAYAAQRVLPSAVVYLALGGAGIVRGTVQIIASFQWLDATCMALAAYLWGRIGLVLAWSRAAAWAGFFAIFASYALARQALYYPTLTDSAAFFLGMVTIWAFLARRSFVLWLVGLLGAFTWPALPAVALGLLILRREPLVGPPMPRRIALALAATTAGAAAVLALYFLARPVSYDVKWARRVPIDLLAVTVPTLTIWSGAAWYLIARSTTGLVASLKQLIAWRTLAALCGIAVISVLLTLWMNLVVNQGYGPTPRQFACELALESLRGPFWGLVHHVVYFGPIVLVAIGAWPQVARTAASWGLGAVLTLAMIVAFAIGSESRQWIHLFPLLVAMTIAATHAWWTPRRAIAFAVLCLAWSKVWWPIHYDWPRSAFEWPALRYYMQHGPWASDETYLWHLGAALVTALVLLALRRIK